MCGIIGVVTTENNCFEILLNGLKQLQNRGYDSAGICSIGMERAAALSEAKGAGERGNSGDDCRRSWTDTTSDCLKSVVLLFLISIKDLLRVFIFNIGYL